MNDITLSVVGNVVNDVDLRFTPSGEAVASFRVASTTRRFDRNNERWIDGDTHYFTVSCWRNVALRSSAKLPSGGSCDTVNDSFSHLGGLVQRNLVSPRCCWTLCRPKSRKWTAKLGSFVRYLPVT